MSLESSGRGPESESEESWRRRLVAPVASPSTGRDLRAEGSMPAEAGRTTLLVSRDAAAMDRTKERRLEGAAVGNRS